MEKHLASGSLQAWQYSQTLVGEAFESLERDLRKTIQAEAEKNYHDFLAEYKRQINKATSTAFKPWEDLIKKWQDKLKEVDSSLSLWNGFKRTIHEEAFTVLSDESRKFYDTLDTRFTTLEAGKQELHQVVADSITTHVSDLQDSLTRSNQALQQSTQALQQSTQLLASTQKHLDTAVQELQRLHTISGRDDYTAEAATMSNTALAQLAQSKSTQQLSREAWASAPRVSPADTVTTPTTDTPHAASKDSDDPTPTTNVPTTDAAPTTAAPTTTPQRSDIPTPPPHVEDDESHNNFYRREDTKLSMHEVPQYHRHDDHSSQGYTRRDYYSSRSPRFHNDTPRSYHDHERDSYRERDSYPPQYSDMAQKDKLKLTILQLRSGLLVVLKATLWAVLFTASQTYPQ